MTTETTTPNILGGDWYPVLHRRDGRYYIHTPRPDDYAVTQSLAVVIPSEYGLVTPRDTAHANMLSASSHLYRALVALYHDHDDPGARALALEAIRHAEGR